MGRVSQPGESGSAWSHSPGAGEIVFLLLDFPISSNVQGAAEAFLTIRAFIVLPRSHVLYVRWFLLPMSLHLAALHCSWLPCISH